MKLAIPSNDRLTLSPHFGRTAGFLIFEVVDGNIVHEEYRLNAFTNHATGQHNQYGHLGHLRRDGHPEDHGHNGKQDQHGHHSHERIVDALCDCEVVISGGMGYRLQVDLKQAGKQIFITHVSEVRKAVELFLQNSLESDKEACRQHS